MFADEVLKYVCSQFNTGDSTSVYLDMENEVRLFRETIRPDYQIMRAAQPPLSKIDVPMYAIEVKRTVATKRNLPDYLAQHFKQLRHLCI